MFDVMSQAKNAMESYSTKLKAISANISNLQVTGYKRTDVSFQNLFSKLVSPGTSAFENGNEGGTNPLQVGGTVAISSSSVDFKQGTFSDGANIDIGVNDGSRLFIASADGGNTFWYTKSGEFQIVNNKLYTKSGYQVYGFKRTSGTTSTQLEAIDLSNVPYTDVTKITWDDNGVMRDSYDEETKVYGKELPYQIATASFKNPSGLKYENGTMFSETLASGQPSSPSVPLTGTVYPRKREQSNVVYTSEIVDSLETQRALDATMTVIRMANDTITQFINKLS